MPKAHIFAAITAAGESQRMGSPKGLLPWGDRTFIKAMLMALIQAELLGSTGVVVRREEAKRYAAIVEPDVKILVNPNPDEGRFSSIRIAARWALKRGAGGADWTSLLLWPVDCPGVDHTVLARLCKESLHHPNDNIVPTFAGRGGHPVILCDRMLRRIVGAELDTNLRDLMSDGTVERRNVPVADPAILDNVNCPEAYAKFKRTRTPPRRQPADHG